MHNSITKLDHLHNREFFILIQDPIRILLGTILFVFADDFVRLMGADEELVSMASQYLRVYAACSPFTTIVFAVDNYLRICGKVRYSMMVNILMSVSSATLRNLSFRKGSWTRRGTTKTDSP